jgi:hypothetical protein
MSTRSIPSLLRATLLLLLAIPGIGCVYLTDRALDFLDPYRISVGAGSAIGARTSNLGLWDTGLMIGIKPNAAALGWRYGKPLFFNQKDGTFDADQAQIFISSSIRSFDYANGSYQSGTESFAVLPVFFTLTDATPTRYDWTVPETEALFDDLHYLWSVETFENNRFAQIHAFDIELDFGLFVYMENGFSPGEVVDFLLGFLTIDIAQDDNRLGLGDPPAGELETPPAEDTDTGGAE